MADYLLVRRRVAIPRRELQWRFSRTMKPLGYSVNTRDARVELTWNAIGTEALPPTLKERLLERLQDELWDGTVTVSSSEHRTQRMNRKAAEAKLAKLITDALMPAPPRRRPTHPSRQAVQARLDAKRHREAREPSAGG
jgi:ribosome-associated protein